MGRIGRCVIVVAALGWGAGEVRAEGGPTVRVAGLAPFSEAELAEALRLRLGGEHRVEVVSGARGITITVDGRTRSIRLGHERGVEAARVVALVAAGMVIDEAQEKRRDQAPTSGNAMVAAGPGPGPRVDEEDEVERDADEAAPVRRWTLAGLLTPAGAAGTHSATGVMLAFDRAQGVDGVRLMMAIGVTSSSIDLGEMAPTIRTVEVPIRAGAWLGDRYAVGASAVAVPYETRGGAGDRNVLFGAGVMARAQVMLGGGGTGVVAQVGIDGMASSVEYRWEGDAVLASGRFRPWLAIGVTWEGGP